MANGNHLTLEDLQGAELDSLSETAYDYADRMVQDIVEMQQAPTLDIETNGLAVGFYMQGVRYVRTMHSHITTPTAYDRTRARYPEAIIADYHTLDTWRFEAGAAGSLVDPSDIRSDPRSNQIDTFLYNSSSLIPSEPDVYTGYTGLYHLPPSVMTDILAADYREFAERRLVNMDLFDADEVYFDSRTPYLPPFNVPGQFITALYATASRILPDMMALGPDNRSSYINPDDDLADFVPVLPTPEEWINHTTRLAGHTWNFDAVSPASLRAAIISVTNDIELLHANDDVENAQLDEELPLGQKNYYRPEDFEPEEPGVPVTPLHLLKLGATA